MPIYTRPETLEFKTQIIGVIPQAGPLSKESSPNSNPSHLQPLPPPYRGPFVLGDRDQTRPMTTCTRTETLEFKTQIIIIIPQVAPPPKESSPNSNPSHLQPLPPPYSGPCVLGDRDQTRPMTTCTRTETLELKSQITVIIPQAAPPPKESSPNSNPFHLQSLPPPYSGPFVLGDRDQTRPMTTCTRPETLELKSQITVIIPKAGPLTKESSPNSNPSHLQPLPPPYSGLRALFRFQLAQDILPALGELEGVVRGKFAQQFCQRLVACLACVSDAHLHFLYLVHPVQVGDLLECSWTYMCAYFL